MKKGRILVLLALLLVAALALSSFAYAQTEPLDQLSAPTDKSEDFYLKQANSIQTYNQILNSFSIQNNSRSSGETAQPYPDYYGGAYIDEETGGLVVLVTNLAAVPQTLHSITEGNTDVEYELCNVSFNQMVEAIDTISAKIPQLAEDGVIVDSVGDDILNGRVVVSVRNLTEEKAQKIRDVADYPFLHMENSVGITADAWYGAGHTITEANGANSTLGFAAVQNLGAGDVYGFVIAGHSAKTVGETIKIGNTTIGTVTHTGWYNYSSADAAFVAAADGVGTTNVTYFGGILVDAGLDYLPCNTTVYKYGITTGLTVGKVTGIYQTFTSQVIKNGVVEEEKIFVNTWKADYECADGDSGGPVMVYIGSNLGYTEYKLYGIHIGSNTTAGIAFFSPYKNIVDELGVTCRLTAG